MGLCCCRKKAPPVAPEEDAFDVLDPTLLHMYPATRSIKSLEMRGVRAMMTEGAYVSAHV